MPVLGNKPAPTPSSTPFIGFADGWGANSLKGAAVGSNVGAGAAAATMNRLTISETKMTV
jgi:hypothetical protein